MLRLYLGLGYMILFRFQYDNNSHWRSAWDVSSILSFGPVGKMGKRDVETNVVWAHNIDSAKDLCF